MRLRLVALVLIAVGTVFAAIAVAVTGWGQPVTGWSPTGDGSEVNWVLPGGPAWREGMRGGQRVLELDASVDPDTWRLMTSDRNGVVYTATYRGMLNSLRDALPAAVGAVVLAAAAWLSIRRPALAAALAVAALAVSAQTLIGSGLQVQSTLAALAAAAALCLWLGVFGDWRQLSLRLLALAIFAAAGAWLVARVLEPELYSIADAGRQVTTAGGVLGVAVVLAGSRRWRESLVSIGSQRVADLFVFAAVLAVAIIVALVTEASPVVLLLAIGVGVLGYPLFRLRLSGAFDELLFEEIRGRASLAAVENERGRISRDLHDAPLQEISAVIRSLDQHPDTQREAELLRQAAGHLRRVSTELRPPVLDDLGLAAALAYLADQVIERTTSVSVSADIVPNDPLATRAPRDVELGLFRIAQEALDNAIQHAQATTIEIRASIEPEHVSLSTEDDGIGVADDAARNALRAGHLGLATMAQRASLIGATFTLSPVAPHGTRIDVEWQAPR